MILFHKWLRNLGYNPDELDKNTYTILLKEYEELVDEMIESIR